MRGADDARPLGARAAALVNVRRSGQDGRHETRPQRLPVALPKDGRVMKMQSVQLTVLCKCQTVCGHIARASTHTCTHTHTHTHTGAQKEYNMEGAREGQE